MEQKITEELLAELLDAEDPGEFVENNELASKTLSEYLQELLEEKGLRRVDVVRNADLNETFGYQIFMGTRKASRNKVLQIAFAMKLTLKETNRLLQHAGASNLYCRNRRDAIIIFCITRRCSLQEVNEELYDLGEETIC